MKFDRQLVRLMAAMIVMIIAYVAPSAVQAHEGHGHHGHRQVAQTGVGIAPAVVPAPSRTTPSVASAALRAIPATAVGLAAGSIQADEQGRGCCPGPCKGTCCGTMSCCVPGILAGAATLPTLAFGHVVLVSHEVEGRSGVGPEALPRPPRTLA